MALYKSYVLLLLFSRDSVECDLEFLGLLIMQNKLKPETIPAIDELNEAKIRTLMVTGKITGLNLQAFCLF